MKSLRGLVKCPNFTFILLGRSKAKDEGLRNFKSFRFTFGKFHVLSARYKLDMKERN